MRPGQHAPARPAPRALVPALLVQAQRRGSLHVQDTLKRLCRHAAIPLERRNDAPLAYVQADVLVMVTMILCQGSQDDQAPPADNAHRDSARPHDALNAVMRESILIAMRQSVVR